jgi:hypothetical protein
MAAQPAGRTASGSDPVIADVLGFKDAQATGIVDPDTAGGPT